MTSRPARRAWRGAAVLGAALLTCGCSSGSGDGTGDGAAASTEQVQACKWLISGIGYAESLLLPPGHEADQSFDAAVRGRVAYAGGVVTLTRSKLPATVLPKAEQMAATIDRLSGADDPHDQQVAALREFRVESAEVVDECSRVTGQS